ncbi:peptidyl-prolyl cis-trans isomerase [Acidisphaera sp. S103]|uniref:peptidylprolyl isomerase n=1 Tax=Acidisphaera sp. S103 TaxID=1747223 RepID=UPI00131D9B4D|nr:peptidyl-prolyl cis-trans isomerase [Acidisphaera sp. S103]
MRSAAFAQTVLSGPPSATPSGKPEAQPPVPAVNSLVQLADQFDKSSGTIVADVNGTPITLGMVADRLRDLPPQLAALPETVVYKAALDDLIQQRALAIKARELGVDKDAVAQRHIGEATDHALAGAMVQRILPELITEKAIKDRYDAIFAGKPGPDEVRFRVIATTTESAANDVLTALRNGADFAKLARDESRDPSNLDGGEINYTRRDLLTPEIGAVAFALSPGQTTAYPVRSNGLWFVIQVEGRQQTPAPPLDSVREQIVASLTRQADAEISRKARAAVTVKDYGVTGTSGRDTPANAKSH